MKFEQCLIQQIKKHPSMQPQDVVKLCYQAAFGAEHLLADMDAAKKYFYAEYDSVPVGLGDLYEEISPDICRINFSAWKACGMPAEWLFAMFAHTASVAYGSEELFWHYLLVAQEMLSELEACDIEVGFTAQEWQDYVAAYKACGIRAVHHSDTYREKEHPAYRIVSSRFLSVLPILEKAATVSNEQSVFLSDHCSSHGLQSSFNGGTAGVIAIDGRAASGKSTMAELLAMVLNAGVIHMDDFFLPLELRTPQRFAEPGGNVHYERFAEEVLPVLRGKESFSYTIFDCSKMELSGKRQVTASSWRIVEGSYSHHPKLGDYADLKVFLDVDEEEQMRRIEIRNGEQMAKIFKSRWIPLEEGYFENCLVREKADLVIVSIDRTRR